MDDPEHKYEITLPKKELTLMNKEISKNVISESNDYEYPIVGDYSIVPSNGNFESTAQTKVVFELTNCNNTMHTFLSLNVQRPITQLILCVTFPENLKVKNIVIKKKLLFGDYKDEKLSAQNYTMTKKNHGNTHSLKKVSYKIVINQPKMFYCYSINWEWK